MLSGLTTKLALRKAGLPSDMLDMGGSTFGGGSDRSPGPNKLRKPMPPGTMPMEEGGSWASWMSVRSLPLSVQPWLAPPPAAAAVGRVPGIGDRAPADPQGRIELGGGQRVLVVFLRCVGCAFAQKTFVNLRTLANRYGDSLTCIAVSHASPQATRKWVDLCGGAWAVRVVVDEERALYAAWGLGVASVWHLFNPTTQVQGWRETGWLGDKVAGAIQRNGIQETEKKPPPPAAGRGAPAAGGDDDDGPMTVMGNKWQEAGAFAVDGAGNVVWGGKALRADDVMDLDYGARLLMA